LLPDALDRPRSPVETSVVRFIQARLELTHQERAICVISGPWGIGKTTAVDSFVREKAGACAVVKVEQGSSKRGASPVAVLQQSLEAIRPHIGRSPRAALSNAYWSLRQMIYNYLGEWRSENDCRLAPDQHPLFTIIFDEAQYLSREAIEMLRYWNDGDRTITPFPVGLVFVGNSEFALEENAAGQSALSGAVRSRALFVEALEYSDVTDADIISFMASRGPYEPDAMSLVLSYFQRPRVRRDVRSMIRLDNLFRRRSQGAPISLETVQTALL
jgi:hypothetical protein